MPEIIVLNRQDRAAVEKFVDDQRQVVQNGPAARTDTIVDAAMASYIIRPVIHGQQIPPRQSNYPGRLLVAVWKLIETAPKSDIWRLSPVLYPDGTQKGLVLNNVDPNWLEYDFYDLSRDAYGQWVISCCT